MAKTLVYSHAGDLGDLIAGLAALKLLGGGELVLYTSKKVRDPWTELKVERVRSFFEVQDYVRGVHFEERHRGERLDRWRHKPTPRHLRQKGRRNIIDWHTESLRLPPWNHADGWLKVDTSNRVAATVFNKTARYHGDPTMMKVAMERWRDDAVFIGTEAEHAMFITEFGEIDRADTPTLLDAARIISGADRYVGGQSSLLWVAYGLLKETHCEEWSHDPNCHLVRDGLAFYG